MSGIASRVAATASRHRSATCPCLRNLLDQRRAPRAPVLRGQRGDALLRAPRAPRRRRPSAPESARARFPDVGLQSDLGAVLLGEIPVDQPTCTIAGPRAADQLRCKPTSAADRRRARSSDRRATASRDLFCSRVSAPMKHGLSDRNARHRASTTIGRAAERRRQRCGFLQRIALDDFIAGDDDRTLGLEDTRHQRLQGPSDGSTRLSTGLSGRVRYRLPN